MKHFLLLTFLLPVVGLSQTIIPDANFEQKLIDLGYDVGPVDGTVPTENIETVTSLSVFFSNISDLTGIEDFTALTSLNCNLNPSLSTLDLSQNLLLTDLSCGITNISTLDLSQNTQLVSLDCSNSNISSLNLSQNLQLTTLDCSNNNLSTLDVSNNNMLISLNCSGNNLTSIDVTQNTALLTLNCGMNNLSAIDVTQNALLDFFVCEVNSISEIDVTQNTALRLLGITENNIFSLDVSQNAALETLGCGENNLTSLDLSQNPVLDIFIADSNDLSSLNIQNGNNSNIPFFNFDVRDNPNLECVKVDDVDYSTNTWTNIDAGVIFSLDCESLELKDEVFLSFRFHPNPTKYQFTIQLNQTSELQKVRIYNTLGQEVLTSKELVVDTSSLSSGNYIVEVQTTQGKANKKLIIQ